MTNRDKIIYTIIVKRLYLHTIFMKIKVVFTNKVVLMLERFVVEVWSQLFQPLGFHSRQFPHVRSLSLVHFTEQQPTHKHTSPFNYTILTRQEFKQEQKI